MWEKETLGIIETNVSESFPAKPRQNVFHCMKLIIGCNNILNLGTIFEAKNKRLNKYHSLIGPVYFIIGHYEKWQKALGKKSSHLQIKYCSTNLSVKNVLFFHLPQMLLNFSQL